MDKRDDSDKSSQRSPAVTNANIADKDREVSRRWVAAYLSGMDEDDFRKRYFKNQKCQGASVGDQFAKGDTKNTSPSMNPASSCNRLSRQISNMSSGRYSDMSAPRDSNTNDLDCPNASCHTIVSNTDDVLDKWTKRTADDCRLWYIKTLMARKVFSDTPSIKQQKIIIFDWDDTLLCTTHLGKMQGLVNMNISDRDRKILDKTDQTALELLEKSYKYGDTYIITNAARGWVEYSSQLLMPATFKFLQTKSIKVISARSDHEKKFPGETKRWKREAFVEISKKYYYTVKTNVVCLGDSNIEMEAAKQFEDLFCDQSCIKTVKFEAKPDPVSLIKQQIHVIEKFDKIFKTDKNKMIRLEKKKATPQQYAATSR